jgi:hypothetical protein
MIDPNSFRFGTLDFVAMQRLVARPPVRQVAEATPGGHTALAAVLLLVGGTVAALARSH